MIARGVAFVFFAAGLALATLAGVAALSFLWGSLDNALSGVSKHGWRYELMFGVFGLVFYGTIAFVGGLIARLAWRNVAKARG